MNIYHTYTLKPCSSLKEDPTVAAAIQAASQATGLDDIAVGELRDGGISRWVLYSTNRLLAAGPWWSNDPRAAGLGNELDFVANSIVSEIRFRVAT